MPGRKLNRCNHHWILPKWPPCTGGSWRVEAAEYHREQFAAHRDKYGPMIASLLDEGLKILGVDYVSALVWQREFPPASVTDCSPIATPC